MEARRVSQFDQIEAATMAATFQLVVVMFVSSERRGWVRSRPTAGFRSINRQTVGTDLGLVSRNVGILGANYPGYFDVGDTAELSRLLRRAESSPRYLAELKAWSKRLAPLVDPGREEQAWSDLIEELGQK